MTNAKTAGEKAHTGALYQEVPTAKCAFKEQPQSELFLPNPPVCGLTGAFSVGEKGRKRLAGLTINFPEYI